MARTTLTRQSIMNSIQKIQNYALDGDQEAVRSETLSLYRKVITQMAYSPDPAGMKPLAYIALMAETINVREAK